MIRSDSSDATLRNLSTQRLLLCKGLVKRCQISWAHFSSDSSNIMAQVAEFVELSASLQEDKLTLSSELMQPMSATLFVSNARNNR